MELPRSPRGRPTNSNMQMQGLQRAVVLFLMTGRGTLERRVRRTGMLRSFFFTLEEWAEEERWNKANRAFS